MVDNHPGYVLYHVKRVQGYCQDMILEASMAIYMNPVANVEYLNYVLSLPGKKTRQHFDAQLVYIASLA